MKQASLRALAAMMLIGILGTAGYVVVGAEHADVPACCQNKQACCPSQACCKGGSDGAQCPMHRHA